MTGIKAGDEVRLFAYGTRAGRGLPEGGLPGTVIKTGRKYATAVFEFWPGEQSEISFDMATGRERSGTGRYYVRTSGQVERGERERAAITVLKEHAITLDFARRKFTIDQIEALAEVVKGWEA